MADSDKTEIEFYDDAGSVRVEQNAETKSSIGLIFDFHQQIYKHQYYTWIESLMGYFVAFPVVAAILIGFVTFLNMIYFYQNISELIHRRYADAQKWSEIQKYLRKFKKIHAALFGIEQYQSITDEIEKCINIDFENLSYDEVDENLKKMHDRDQMLPNLDDLEMNTNKFSLSEAEKAKNAELDAIINERTQFSLVDIVNLIKKRVSIMGIFNLYDDMEMNDASIRAEVKIANAKLEFLYRTLEKKKIKG